MRFSLLAILLTLSILSIPLVYAEEKEEEVPLTVEITVSPDPEITTMAQVAIPHIISENNPDDPCQTQWEGYIPLTICMWRGVAPDGSEAVYDPVKEEWTSAIILQQEAKEEYAEIIAVQKELAKTPEQKRLDVLVNKANPTPEDLWEIELLEKLGALCVNDTLVSQTYREFDVPTAAHMINGTMSSNLFVDQSVKTSSLRHNVTIRDLEMAVQECIGQPYTKKSAQYDHIVVDDVYSEQIDRTSEIPTWPQSRVLDESNPGLSLSEINPMCTSYNSDSTKRDYGCTEKVRSYESTYIPERQLSFSEHPMIEALKRFNSGDQSAELEKIKGDIRDKNYQRLK